MPHAIPMPMADHHHRLPALTLILGGARSGKSAYAEQLLADAPHPIYLATAQAEDSEMIDRIRQHQTRRGDRWLTVEEPFDLLGTLSLQSHPERPVLVDCLTLWLSNLLLGNAPVEREIDRLIQSLPNLSGPVVFVANEVGLGIVPDNALARAFRDHAGRLNQMLAARCQRVVFVAAGLPLLLKESR